MLSSLSATYYSRHLAHKSEQNKIKILAFIYFDYNGRKWEYQSLGFLIIIYLCVLVAQLCPTLCIPMDWGPPDSSIHGILQARILELVAIPFSNYLFRRQ